MPRTKKKETAIDLQQSPVVCGHCKAGPFQHLRALRIHTLKKHHGEEVKTTHTENGHAPGTSSNGTHTKKRKKSRLNTKVSAGFCFCPRCGLDLEKLAIALQAVENI